MSEKSFGVECTSCNEMGVVVVLDRAGGASYFCEAHAPDTVEDGFTRVAFSDLPVGEGRLLFRYEDVRRLMDSGGVISWAKDTGTYLGVWGSTGLELVAPAYTTSGLCLDDSVDARGNPEAFELIWDTTRSICGGDDFLERGLALPEPPPGARYLIMDVVPDSYSLHWE